MQGTVARISTERGVGFITPDEEGGEVFFRRDALQDADFERLAEGTAVEFTLDRDDSDREHEGLRAVDVRLATAEPPEEVPNALAPETVGRP